jgi:hypothetical protein
LWALAGGFAALVGVAPVSQLFAKLLALSAGGVSLGAPGLPLNLTELLHSFSRSFTGLPGLFPRFPGALPDLISPLPPPLSSPLPMTGCIPNTSAAHNGQRPNRKHPNRNHAEDQKFHGVIDEGSPNLFRKKYSAYRMAVSSMARPSAKR